jgi:transposase-like protein
MEHLATQWGEEACFQKLFAIVQPEGLHCPRCGARDGLKVHRHHVKGWIVDYRCCHCGRVFNAWTGTPFQKTHHPPSELLQIITGIAKGEPTAKLARELGCDRVRLSSLCHRWQRLVAENVGRPPKKDQKG